jgi:hypothetical protein
VFEAPNRYSIYVLENINPCPFAKGNMSEEAAKLYHIYLMVFHFNWLPQWKGLVIRGDLLTTLCISASTSVPMEWTDIENSYFLVFSPSLLSFLPSFILSFLSSFLFWY